MQAHETTMRFTIEKPSNYFPSVTFLLLHVPTHIPHTSPIMADHNPNARLEAFSDGVFAIALTLLILDIKLPPSESIHTTGDFWMALLRIAPSIAAFLLSF